MSAEKRSAVMARIRGRDSRPELLVTRTLHTVGYGFSYGYLDEAAINDEAADSSFPEEGCKQTGA